MTHEQFVQEIKEVGDKELEHLREAFDCNDKETNEFVEDFIERKVTHKTETDYERTELSND